MAGTLSALHSYNRAAFEVRFVEGREGIRDRNRDIEDTLKVLRSESYYMDAAKSMLCPARLQARQDAMPLIQEARRSAKLMAEEGGHRFDDEFYQEHKYHGVATVVIHPNDAGTFSATAAMLHLYPPEVEGQRPVLCKTTEEISSLLQIIRPDIAAAEHGSQTICGYMGQFRGHGSDVILLAADTLLDHPWVTAVFEALTEQNLYEDTATCFKAKLCGGDGRSRSQHKISQAKFRLLFPEHMDTFCDAFFAPQRRAKPAEPAARPSKRGRALMQAEEEQEAEDITDNFFYALRRASHEHDRDEALAAHTFLSHAEHIFGPKTIARAFGHLVDRKPDTLARIFGKPTRNTAKIARHLMMASRKSKPAREALHSDFLTAVGTAAVLDEGNI